MSRIIYRKFIPGLIDEIDLEELLDRLKGFFLESGFYSRFNPQGTPGQSLQSLKRALARLLSENEVVPEEWRQQLRRYAQSAAAEDLSDHLDEFLERLIRRLAREGYLRIQPLETGSHWDDGEGKIDTVQGQVQFELTDKSIDFLGYKTLRELMSSLGRSSFGRHSTRELATGVETDAHSRPYEFGDTLNLDISETLLNAVRRDGLGVPLNLDYADLMVYQTEFQSSCATVLMLDCSHSMILYGEDRFTPAKQVALALAHLIRTQFPGDALRLVLFHDSAEEVPLAKLPAVRVGPFHTNTCEGFRLARRILLNQKKDMRQIIMITDGKPSALTLPDGRVYKNPFGLDPMILQQTYDEAAKCRKAGILINTFMLARDYYLMDFVKKITEICRGKAYFTSTVNLADSILMDFMTRKTRTVH